MTRLPRRNDDVIVSYDTAVRVDDATAGGGDIQTSVDAERNLFDHGGRAADALDGTSRTERLVLR
jgi:hypothetical protein